MCSFCPSEGNPTVSLGGGQHGEPITANAVKSERHSMRITSRRGTIVFFLCLGIGLVALAIALNVGWIILNWREKDDARRVDTIACRNVAASRAAGEAKAGVLPL